MGQYRLNHMLWKGQTFCWLLSNVLSYVAWLSNNIQDLKEVERPNDPISWAKFRLVEYVNHFKEGRVMRAMKRQEVIRSSSSKSSTLSTSMSKSTSTPTPTSASSSAIPNVQVNAHAQVQVGEDTELWPVSEAERASLTLLVASVVQLETKGDSHAGTYF